MVEHHGCRLLRRHAEEALSRFGNPEMLRSSVVGLRLNTKQGSQFISFAFTSLLRDAEARISMDGRGR